MYKTMCLLFFLSYSWQILHYLSPELSTSTMLLVAAKESRQIVRDRSSLVLWPIVMWFANRRKELAYCCLGCARRPAKTINVFSTQAGFWYAKSLSWKVTTKSLSTQTIKILNKSIEVNESFNGNTQVLLIAKLWMRVVYPRPHTQAITIL